MSWNETKLTLDDVENIFDKNDIIYRVEDKYTWKEDGLTMYEITVFVNEEKEDVNER